VGRFAEVELRTEPAAAKNAYDVSIVEGEHGWRVEISSVEGSVVSSRACRDGAEARTYASTVRQHLYWLSADRFADYYGLEG
jgi:hypothetical protein